MEVTKEEAKSLEKDNSRDKSLEKDNSRDKSLEKDLASSPTVERYRVILKPAPPKKVVVVGSMCTSSAMLAAGKEKSRSGMMCWNSDVPTFLQESIPAGPKLAKMGRGHGPSIWVEMSS